MKKLFILLALSILFSSCTKEDVVIEDDSPFSTTTITGTYCGTIVGLGNSNSPCNSSFLVVDFYGLTQFICLNEDDHYNNYSVNSTYCLD